MNIAYCISAYKDESNLFNLVNSLNTDKSFFFIHIDKKVANIATFKSKFESYKNVYFLNERYFIQWGGWNQVLYQRLFIEKALSFPYKIDRIIILTGQDYPLWKNSEIFNYFKNYPNKIMMKGINLSKLEIKSKMYNLLPIYHWGRDWKIKNYTLWRYITGLIRKVMTYIPIHKKRYIIVNEKKWDIYQASGYFSINREQAEYIIQYLYDKSIISYFSSCFVPEELTIPTIIYNSKYKNDAEIFHDNAYRGLSTLASLHVFIYDKSIKVFTENDFEYLINSKKMFCRKVVTGISDNLIELINIYRKDEE